MRAVFLFLFLTFTSCTPQHMLSKDDPWTALFEEHEAQQIKNHQMKLVAAGPNQASEVDAVALHYVTFRKLKIPQIRELIVQSVQEFLVMINRAPDIFPLLAKHPLKAKDVRFNVGFGKIDGGFQEPPYVAYAYLVNGKITYCYLDNLFGHFVEEDDVEESYNTALQLLIEEKAKR